MGVLEHLSPEDWATARRNFERLDGLFSLAQANADGKGFTVAGVGVRFGAFSGTTAASGEVVIPITHGLGKTPVAAFMTSDSAASVQVTVRAVSPTSTTIGAYVVRSTAAAVSVGGYWMVIG